MPVYIAMFRGVNVLGRKVVKMEALRASFHALGIRGAKTYVNSGNVVFETAEKSSASLSKKIGDRILRDFGFPVSVVLITSKDLQKVVQQNPFAKRRAIDSSKLHITFLADPPTTTARRSLLKNLQALSPKPDLFSIGTQEIYLYCPDGYGRTKLSNAVFEKMLSVAATTRTWRTVNKLSEMAST